jgi:C1A family cysteine protease
VDRPEFQVGFGDVTSDSWEWYEGPRDDVLTLESYEPYTATNGDVLVVVVLVDTVEFTLKQLTLGEYEVRALGDEWSESDITELDKKRWASSPEMDAQRQVSDLPSSVDLTSGCSPVRNQGSIGSCTAFAVGPGAYDYELGSIYDYYGWDFNNDFNLSSPKWLYRKTGTGCGGGSGRTTWKVVDYLKTDGTSTEENCPYINVCTSDCTGQDAYDDAELLQIDSWSFAFRYWVEDETTPIKAVLADEERVLVMRTNVDSGIFGYQAGDVWNYTGPTIGGHAMCVVGYDDSKEAFKVRNSWGASWGDNGYLWIGYDTFLNEDAGVYCCKMVDSYSEDVRQRFLKPPSITITAPSDGATVSGTTDFTADVSDDTGVDLVEMYIDGEMVAGFTSEPYEYSWDTTGYHGGAHTLKVYAEDDTSIWYEKQITVYVENHTVTGIDPVSGITGTTVTIDGTSFLAGNGDAYNGSTDKVFFSAVSGWCAATVTDWQEEEIEAIVPGGAVTGPVKVDINGAEVTSSFDFTVLPHIDALNPPAQEIGANIIIEGTGFGGSANEDSYVDIGGLGAAIVSWSNTEIGITIPSGVTKSDLTVTVTSGTSNALVFKPKPNITGLDPNRTWPGNEITITGISFGNERGDSTINFAGPVQASPEDITSWSDSEIVVVLSEGAKRGDVVVTVDGVASEGEFLIVILSPPVLGGVQQY